MQSAPPPPGPIDIVFSILILVWIIAFLISLILVGIDRRYPLALSFRVSDWADTIVFGTLYIFVAGCVVSLIYSIGSCTMQGAKDVASSVNDNVVKPSIDAGSFPFYVAGIVGFALLYISVRTKHVVIGGLGGALVAAAFSHWVGPLDVKSFIPGK